MILQCGVTVMHLYPAEMAECLEVLFGMETLGSQSPYSEGTGWESYSRCTVYKYGFPIHSPGGAVFSVASSKLFWPCVVTISGVVAVQKEDERLRASIRRESQQRRMRERANQRGMSSSYLEGDYDHEDGDNAISISAIKKRYKQNQKRMHFHQL